MFTNGESWPEDFATAEASHGFHPPEIEEMEWETPANPTPIPLILKDRREFLRQLLGQDSLDANERESATASFDPETLWWTAEYPMAYADDDETAVLIEYVHGGTEETLMPVYPDEHASHGAEVNGSFFPPVLPNPHSFEPEISGSILPPFIPLPSSATPPSTFNQSRSKPQPRTRTSRDTNRPRFASLPADRSKLKAPRISFPPPPYYPPENWN